MEREKEFPQSAPVLIRYVTKSLQILKSMVVLVIFCRSCVFLPVSSTTESEMAIVSLMPSKTEMMHTVQKKKYIFGLF